MVTKTPGSAKLEDKRGTRGEELEVGGLEVEDLVAEVEEVAPGAGCPASEGGT